MKRIQGSSEIKMCAFCCIPNFGVFKSIQFCLCLLNLFKTNYCFAIHDVQPFRVVLSFESLSEKDLY